MTSAPFFASGLLRKNISEEMTPAKGRWFLGDSLCPGAFIVITPQPKGSKRIQKSLAVGRGYDVLVNIPNTKPLK